MKNASREVIPSGRMAGRVPLLQLGQGECKWPSRCDVEVIGGFLFCGRPADGGSYCAKHQALTYVRQRGSERTKPA